MSSLIYELLRACVVVNMTMRSYIFQWLGIKTLSLLKK